MASIGDWLLCHSEPGTALGGVRNLFESYRQRRFQNFDIYILKAPLKSKSAYKSSKSFKLSKRYIRTPT